MADELNNAQKLGEFWILIRNAMEAYDENYEYDGPLGSDLTNETLNDLSVYLPRQNQKNYAIALLNYFIPELNVSVDKLMTQPIKKMFSLEEKDEMQSGYEADDIHNWQDYK
jgi:hypothetical protein